MLADEPENLTVAETIARYRIGRTKLFGLIASGEIEAIKLGARTLVKRSSVDSFMRSLPKAGARA